MFDYKSTGKDTDSSYQILIAEKIKLLSEQI